MRPLVFLATALLVAAGARNATADDRPWFDPRTTAPSRALELTIGTGYSQPFGMLERGVGMPSVATPGPAIELGIGYRIDEHWSIAAAGQFAELTAERSHTARTFTPALVTTYHFRPTLRFDPWIDVASGYRLLWESTVVQNAGVLTHGFELARVRLGLDYHEGGMGVGPLVGAGANLFLWQETSASARAIESPRVSVFVFAGVQGRWDVY